MEKVQPTYNWFGMRELLFVIALATKPIYLKSSGSIQISDILYVILFISFLVRGELSFPSIKEQKWTVLFLLVISYQFVINVVWGVICSIDGYSAMAMIRNTRYFLFNLFVCITVFQLCSRIGYERLFRLYIIGSLLSVLVCYIGVIANWRGKGRVTGFFNNPNQLGYYAIIMMTVFVIYCRKINEKIVLLMIMMCILLNIWSLSKASLIGSAALLISYALVFSKKHGMTRTVMTIIAVLLVTVLLYFIMYSDYPIFTNSLYIRTMRNRLLNMANESDSNLGAGRGYDRIKEIGVFIVSGVGQGAYGRFATLRGKELHSTYASILVCYGITGLAGYTTLFIKAIYSNNRFLFNTLSMIGILLYSITHNGIRNTLLWTLIAMLLLRHHDTEKGREVFNNSAYYS